MAYMNQPGRAKEVSPVLRGCAALLAVGALLTSLMMGFSWYQVRGASIVWLFGAVGMLGGAAAFGYAAITGKTPMAPD